MTDERFDVAYLILSGTTTAARGPELLRGLLDLGFSTVIAIPTPNAEVAMIPSSLFSDHSSMILRRSAYTVSPWKQSIRS